MRKLKMYNMTSVDGYFSGLEGDIGWHTVDSEFNLFAIETLSTVNTIMFGRVTYDLFKGYWPEVLADPTSSPEDKIIAQAIEDATKIVFSKSNIDTSWNGTEHYRDISAEEITKMKQQDGKDIIIYGSGTIVQQLANLGVIDEYQLIVSPIILGTGKPLFANVDQKKLKLSSSRQFKNGNMLLVYVPV